MSTTFEYNAILTKRRLLIMSALYRDAEKNASKIISTDVYLVLLQFSEQKTVNNALHLR